MSRPRPQRREDEIVLPTLRTARLLLRAYTPDDVSRVMELSEVEEVWPSGGVPSYDQGMASAWIRGYRPLPRLTLLELAVTTAADGLVGGVTLRLARRERRAEIGYWVGVPYWNRRIATEAAGAVLAYAFEELGLRRVVARHLGSNPASGRVLRGLGMVHEGTLREHVLHGEGWVDLVCYALLEREWRARHGGGPEPPAAGPGAPA